MSEPEVPVAIVVVSILSSYGVLAGILPDIVMLMPAGPLIGFTVT